MMNYRKHLRNRCFFAFLLLLSFILISCGKEETEQKYAAKVNNATLSEEELKEALSGVKYGYKYRDEFINDWIENEILYQEAEKQGLLEQNEFKSVMDQSKKELAKALLINKFLEENRVQTDPGELKNYYEKYNEDLRLNDKAYKVNLIKLSNEDKAIQFRATAVESGWERTLNVFRGDSSVIESNSKIIILKHEINNLNFLRILDLLNADEISIVFKSEPSVFEVVQVVETYEKGYLPAFDDVAEKIKERYIITKQQELYRKYLDELVTKSKLVINKEHE